MSFSESAKTKVLLWCDRHCCLCKKACGPKIEVHHIVEESKGGSNRIENAIPLCFDCHAIVGMYNLENPIGNKYKPKELKARRDQIYDEFTRNLVPTITYEIRQELAGGTKYQLPKVGFFISHPGNSLPVKILIKAHMYLGSRNLGVHDSDHYSGKKAWNFNPHVGYFGNFSVPDEAVESDQLLKIDIYATIIDQYDRHHKWLPISWAYMRDKNGWYAVP